MKPCTTTSIEHYQIITGYITDLAVYPSRETFIQARKLAGCADIDLNSIGYLAVVYKINQMIAAQDSSGKNDTPNIEQYYRFKLGDKLIEGVCSRVAFADGDYVEVVVDPIDGGSYFAYALRRPADHIIWMHPYVIEGTEASIENPKTRKSLIVKALEMIGISSCIWGLIQLYLQISLVPTLYLFIFGIILLPPLNIFSRKKKQVNTGSPIADRIYTTLGYHNPKQFNIEKEQALFLKKLEQLSANYIANYKGPLTDGEEIIKEFLDQYKDQQSPSDTESDKLIKHYIKIEQNGMQWVYLYRCAPTIPNYITVIHTERNNDEIESSNQSSNSDNCP
ncbi:hypothetical protein J3U22_10110 [Gilliamella sp. B2865]|uniref:hypothetical protein n=1 Tax=unclassified Gilliamella TaxID=2685620 RepID=UPI00226A6ECA|nr:MULTISPECIES: hypothetical protein [unclassified Gilliamella]MCX8586566.1 hypothetical protein [Gilliamella sp. B3562]MCX8671550.1 hypothetical protein [Gilliamella sp. B2785]MCX8674666.1 hypothetical protein [Gilliamella sp. B3023]MCX8679964.1 hypothetical protein [Gilliamella sp. B2865]MCX8686129.1 hypothetical protein [Gilliamella sp. B2864]